MQVFSKLFYKKFVCRGFIPYICGMDKPNPNYYSDEDKLLYLSQKHPELIQFVKIFDLACR